MNVYGRFCFNYFARNLDNLLVGWRFGSDALGFYKKAYDLFLLPASQLLAPLTSVAVSALSRLTKDRSEYQRYFLGAVSVLAFLGMGLGGDLTLMGKDIIRLVLGPGWAPAGRIFTFFGPGVGIMLLYGTHGWIHLSIGTAGRWFRWVIVEFAVTALLFGLALPWGPVGIAVAWSASFCILMWPAFWYAGKPIGLSAMPVLGAIWKYVVAAFLASSACAVVMQHVWLGSHSDAVGAAAGIAVTTLIFSPFYLALVTLLHLSFAPIQTFWRLLQEMVPWERGTPRLSDTRPTPAAEAAELVGAGSSGDGV